MKRRTKHWLGRELKYYDLLSAQVHLVPWNEWCDSHENIVIREQTSSKGQHTYDIHVWLGVADFHVYGYKDEYAARKRIERKMNDEYAAIGQLLGKSSVRDD